MKLKQFIQLEVKKQLNESKKLTKRTRSLNESAESDYKKCVEYSKNPKEHLVLIGTDLTELPPDLIKVDEILYLANSKIESLGNLEYVGGDLNLESSSIESLGNLKEVGKDLNLLNTPIAKKYTEQQIRKTVKVKGDIYLWN